VSIPVGIQTEIDAAVMRTGMTPALRRAADVLDTLLRLRAADVEQLFALQGQADAIAAVGVKDTPYEFTITSGEVLHLTDWHRFC
jgi:hypothetical protein